MKMFPARRADRHDNEDGERRWTLVRASLAFLALNAASVGLWATFAPRSWFGSFPGAGHHWAGVDGPYNHHLTSDVGALSLALLVVTATAIASRSQAMIRTAGMAWLASTLPHFIYHFGHRHVLANGDQLASLGGLALQVFLAALCVVAAPTDGTDARTPPTAARAASPSSERSGSVAAEASSGGA